MPERKHDKDTARFADLESRLTLLESLHGKELKDQEYRRQERARMQREKQAWKNELPQRLEALETFLDRCCVREAGVHCFQGLLWRTYCEWCGDTRSERRKLSGMEIAEREEKARLRGETFAEPERPEPVTLDHRLQIPQHELVAAMLSLPDIQESKAPNRFNTKDATFTGVGVRPEFRQPGDCYLVEAPAVPDSHLVTM